MQLAAFAHDNKQPSADQIDDVIKKYEAAKLEVRSAA